MYVDLQWEINPFLDSLFFLILGFEANIGVDFKSKFSMCNKVSELSSCNFYCGLLFL